MSVINFRIPKFKVAAVATLLAVSVCALPCQGAGKGEKSVGLRGGYTTANKSAVAGLYFQYSFSDHFRIAPDIDYSFRNNGTDAISLNLNAHVPFRFESEKVALYPLAGLNYTSWNIHKRIEIEDNDDAKSRIDRLGLNIGGGVEYYVKPTLKLGFEGKYRWTRDYNSGVLNLSIGYVF